jgi:polysaccharide export outer membrane protein
MVRCSRCLIAWSCAAGIVIGLSGARAFAQLPQVTVAVAPDYIVESPDLLGVVVWKHADLSGEFAVDPSGAISLPLIGQVKVVGWTTKQIEAEVTRLLADGFIRQPQVTVTVRAVRSKQVFVAGEIALPGPIPLTGEMTVIEAITRAGALGDRAGGEVIVVRRDAGSRVQGPALPGSPEAKEILRLDINDLRSGRVVQNVPLENGDTVFVTRAEVIFVHGQVNSPGSYPFEKGMTVLRALTVAGGPARLGAANRVRIRRLVGGRLTDIRVELTDPVEPDDEIFVPTRLL